MKNFKVPSFAHGHDGVNREKSMVKRERNISYTSGVAAIKPGIQQEFWLKSPDKRSWKSWNCNSMSVAAMGIQNWHILH